MLKSLFGLNYRSYLFLILLIAANWMGNLVSSGSNSAEAQLPIFNIKLTFGQASSVITITGLILGFVYGTLRLNQLFKRMIGCLILISLMLVFILNLQPLWCFSLLFGWGGGLLVTIISNKWQPRKKSEA